MKKYISIFTIVIGLLLNEQTDYKPMFIYNFSSYDLQIEVNTCNENSVFDGTISSIQWPVFKSPSTFTVAASGGTFSFDYVNSAGNSGLSYRGVDVPNSGFWKRQFTSSSSYISLLTQTAQVAGGTTQVWWYAKLGIWAPNADYVAGNLGNWGNTVEDGYSVLIGNNLQADWIEVPENPNYPEFYTTYIVVSDI